MSCPFCPLLTFGNYLEQPCLCLNFLLNKPLNSLFNISIIVLVLANLTSNVVLNLECDIGKLTQHELMFYNQVWGLSILGNAVCRLPHVNCYLKDQEIGQQHAQIA